MSSSSSLDAHLGRRPKGEVIFTGPDGVSDYRVKVKDASYVGHSWMSTEATSDTQHLYRAPKESPFPQAKSAKVGEVGWGVVKLMDTGPLKSGHQIMLKEFCQANENRYTHRYQTPYYPPPSTSVQADGRPQSYKNYKPLSRPDMIQESFYPTGSETSSKLSLTQQS